VQKKRLVIISALPQEQKALKNIFSQRVFSDMEIDFCLTGVGNSHAIFSLQEYFLQKGVPDFCFNI